MYIRALWLTATCLACISAPASANPTPEMLDFQIEIRGSMRPDRISLQSDDQLDPVALEADLQGARYSAKLERASLFPPGSRKLSAPAQLVVNWPTAAESIYFNIGPTTPSRIRIGVIDPTRPAAFDLPALNAIDSLGRDFESLLQRYLMARRFYKHWRYTKALPNHDIAIRSARIWFDAQTAIVTSKPAVFAKDPELTDVLKHYTTAAVTNSDVKRRFFKYFPSGLVTAANNQVLAAPFSAVGQVPKLVQSGELYEAQRVNTAAMTALKDGDAAFRAVVLSQQGVTTDLLERNDQYIGALLQSTTAYNRIPLNKESEIH